MTKRIEEIKIGDKFTKGDWAFEVLGFDKTYGDNYPVEVRLGSGNPTYTTIWLTKSQTEAINTWIEDTSISQAAADILKKNFLGDEDMDFIDFIQSLVKK